MVKPYLSREVPHAATQRQASNAGGGDNSGWHRQSKCMRRVIDIAPGATAAHAHGPRRRIDMNVLDRRKVDDQAIVADSQTAGVVAAASNRNPQIVFPAEMNGGHHIGYIGALGDQTRLAIDHRVIDLALFVVLLVGRLNQSRPGADF